MRLKYAGIALYFIIITFIVSSSNKSYDNITQMNAEHSQNTYKESVLAEFFSSYENIATIDNDDNYFFDVIDYNELNGETYYYYLVVESFLKEISDLSKDNRTGFNLNLFLEENTDIWEQASNFIEFIIEKNVTINAWEFGRTEVHTSFLSTVEVPVSVSFSYFNSENEISYEKIVYVFIVDKHFDDDMIYWIITDIKRIPSYAVSVLTEADFIIDYDGYSITPYTSFEKLTEQLGWGDEDDYLDNNYGYANTVNGMQIFSLCYPNYKTPKIRVIYHESIMKDSKYISAVEIHDESARGLKKGDSAQKVINLYGLPDEKIYKESLCNHRYYLDGMYLEISLIDNETNVFLHYS